MDILLERVDFQHIATELVKKAEKYGRKMAKDYLKINRKNIYK